VDAFNSNYKFKKIEGDKFYKNLNNVMEGYFPFLSAPTVLRKNEYT